MLIAIWLVESVSSVNRVYRLMLDMQVTIRNRMTQMTIRTTVAITRKMAPRLYRSPSSAPFAAALLLIPALDLPETSIRLLPVIAEPDQISVLRRFEAPMRPPPTMAANTMAPIPNLLWSNVRAQPPRRKLTTNPTNPAAARQAIEMPANRKSFRTSFTSWSGAR